MMRAINDVILGLAILLAVTSAVKSSKLNDPQEERASYWNAMAQDALLESLKQRQNENVAKNVVFFLGDGMGVTTVTAARIYKGQLSGRTGEESILEFERFPHVSLIKTYNVDHQVPDSAGTATAYLCGIKTNYEMIGVTAKVAHRNCSSVAGQEVTSILQWAQEAGKDTGFVTTTRVTHASPSALYAHSASRYWESDADMPDDAAACKDIARQLVEDLPGRDMKVIMGGGRAQFTTVDDADPALDTKMGRRKDGRNLISSWWKDKEARRAKAQYIVRKEEFDKWHPNETDYVLALFDSNHMSYELDRDNGPNGQPSLAEMTTKAIQMLSKNPNGFFLFIEGGRIDHAHHEGRAHLSLADTIAMEEAVRAAMKLCSEEDTTILVTADHSHVLTLNGYPDRGNDIFGIAGVSDVDNMTYTTLMYTNGPGYVKNGTTRGNLSSVKTDDPRFQQPVAVPLSEETHGGEDVAAYAWGPMAHLFHGVQEQHYLPHALSYAACVGRNKGHCMEKYDLKVPQTQGSIDHASSGVDASRTNAGDCRHHPIPVLLLALCACATLRRLWLVPYAV